MYYRPNKLQELEEITANQEAVILAGGTDLIPLVKGGVKEISHLIDTSRVDELKQIEKRTDCWFIGAGVTLTALACHEELAQMFPALTQAARATASLQIRNMGTIGGNIMQDRRCIYFNQSEYWRSNIPKCFKTGGCICHQIPNSGDCRALYYADMSLPLCIYKAQAVIWDKKQKLEIPVTQLIEKHVKTNGTVQPEHLLVEGFILPIPKPGTKSAFTKISIRSSIDFPTIHFSGSCHKETNTVTLYAGAIADIPIELIDTEKIIEDRHILDIEQLAATAIQEMKKKSRLIKEAAISVKVKKDSFQNIRFLLKELLA